MPSSREDTTGGPEFHPNRLTHNTSSQLEISGILEEENGNGAAKEAEHDAPAQNIFSQGGQNYRNLGRWDTIFLLLTNQIGLGVLCLPSCLKVLGIVPGVMAIVGFGALSTYTAYELLLFYRRYPHVVNVAEMCRIVGGRPLEIVTSIGMMLKVMFTCASACVTLSVAFNTISHHSECTVTFMTIAAVGSWALCLPRKVKFLSYTGILSTASIIAAAVVVVVGLAKYPPSQVTEEIWHLEILWIGNPTFREGLNSCLKICYAYAGNISFVSFMAEMRNPSKDFPKALAFLEIFSISLYVIIAIVIYCLAGQYTISPALSSANLTLAMAAYGVALPAVLTTAMSFSHIGAKLMYINVMRTINAAHQVTDRSVKSWATWIACVTLYWIAVWVLSNAVPIFDSILAISSATTISWFTFGLSAVFWWHLNRSSLFRDWKMILLTALNVLLIAQTLFMNAAGLWSSITELMDIFKSEGNEIRGAFSCGDNSGI